MLMQKKNNEIAEVRNATTLDMYNIVLKLKNIAVFQKTSLIMV